MRRHPPFGRVRVAPTSSNIVKSSPAEPWTGRGTLHQYEIEWTAGGQSSPPAAMRAVSVGHVVIYVHADEHLRGEATAGGED